MTIRQSSNDRFVLGPLLVLAVGTFTVGTDSFVLNGLLPTIAADLHVSEATAGQLTTIFAATYAISSPLIAAFTGAIQPEMVAGRRFDAVHHRHGGTGAQLDVRACRRGQGPAAIGAAGFQSNAS